MQIKEYEAHTLKECLQKVRNDLGPDAVILETRKFRKGGILGWGAKDAVCIVAATGITVNSDAALKSRETDRHATAGTLAAPTGEAERKTRAAAQPAPIHREAADTGESPMLPRTAAASARAASAPASHAKAQAGRKEYPAARSEPPERAPRPDEKPAQITAPASGSAARKPEAGEQARLTHLESAMQEIREGLAELRREQREAQERTVSAVVSAVTPMTLLDSAQDWMSEEDAPEEARFPELFRRLTAAGVSDRLASAWIDSLPDFEAWRPEARLPLAESALSDRIAHHLAGSGPIRLTPGRLKAVALVGPTGVGKTTTTAKLAAHFALKEGRRVALLTVDTYRIAAVEQLKTYAQILDIPVAVAYNLAEALPAVEQFADYDLLLIDTAGRSQKNRMQVGELKSLLDMLQCETHLVLAASTRESDMLEAAQRFSTARVDRLLFSKLDETASYGALLNVAEQTGIPLSYLTMGQKVPEDIEAAEGSKLAALLLRAQADQELLCA